MKKKKFKIWHYYGITNHDVNIGYIYHEKNKNIINIFSSFGIQETMNFDPYENLKLIYINSKIVV